jgi:hypothetical protein
MLLRQQGWMALKRTVWQPALCSAQLQRILKSLVAIQYLAIGKQSTCLLSVLNKKNAQTLFQTKRQEK